MTTNDKSEQKSSSRQTIVVHPFLIDKGNEKSLKKTREIGRYYKWLNVLLV